MLGFLRRRPRFRAHLWRSCDGRWHDPLVALRALESGDYNAIRKDPAAVATLARGVFSHAPVAPDGSGVPESLVLHDLSAFLGWLEGKGVTARPSPTSAPSTDSRVG